MKIPVILLFLSSISLSAQNITTVTSFRLDNGLTVYLNEDHTKPEIYGGVVVKAGAKYDPRDATGMGHYLEHMLFKGTEKMGTSDFEKEKPILDTITMLYDKLGQSKGAQRDSIQKQINEASIRAAKYAVPNDIDKMLKGIGSKYVNAFTEYEQIVYYNVFPSHQYEKWLDIYSERFINPVFRMFQSELETVYEEKNRASDAFGYKMFVEFNKHFYKVHPYGQQDILGNTEHLKNPSLSKMYEYYNTYYVANNMALILTGDFDTRKLIPIITEKFGRWRSGEIPEYPLYTEPEFKGREACKGRYLPIKVGVSGYKLPGEKKQGARKDLQAMEICSYLLNNRAETGYLDKLSRDGKVMIAGSLMEQSEDYSRIVVFFAPKIFRQSLRKAEKLVLREIAKLGNGDFTDEQLAMAKANLSVEFEKMLENKISRGLLLCDAFTMGYTWEDILKYPQQIEALTREDIQSVAAKYLSENRLVLYSRTGFPKKDKLKKPGFKPVIPVDSLKSPYSIEFNAMKDPEPRGSFVAFNKDVDTFSFGANTVGYYNNNPINSIFSLQLVYAYGGNKYNELNNTVDYLTLAGGGGMTADSFKNELEKLGCSFYIYAGNGQLNAYISGLEKNAQASIKLFRKFLYDPDEDRKQWKKNLSILKTTSRFEQGNDPTLKGYKLAEYVIYGDSSSYRREPDYKDLKKWSVDEFTTMLGEATNHEIRAFYTGKAGQAQVTEWLKDFAKPQTRSYDSSFKLFPRDYAGNTIYIINDKKVRQSQIYFYVKGKAEKLSDAPVIHAFNSYFGTDMSSLVFQEIREFRSLAYTSYGYYGIGSPKDSIPGYLTCYIGCQSDKTNEAIDVMYKLVNDMPRKADRFPVIKSYMLQSIYSGRPDFRSLGTTVYNWRKTGYQEDPAKTRKESIDSLSFDQITEFYMSRIYNKPICIAIIGDVKSFDLNALKKYGRVVVLKEKEILN